MPTLTTDERLDALEAAVLRIEQGQKDAATLIDTRAAEAAAIVKAEAEAQREAVRVEGARVAEQFSTQGAALLQLSQTLNTVQARIGQWAAAGALLGAVLLFIAVRALGF